MTSVAVMMASDILGGNKIARLSIIFAQKTIVGGLDDNGFKVH